MVYCAAFEMRLGRNPFRGSNPLPSADSIRGFERRTEGFASRQAEGGAEPKAFLFDGKKNDLRQILYPPPFAHYIKIFTITYRLSL